MRVLLLQLDGKIPNLALMRLARHWGDRGAAVELRQVRHPNGVQDGLFDSRPDAVYASLIFEKTRPLAKALLRIRPDAIVGGTGWDIGRQLEDVGVDEKRPDYGIYPGFRQSMGFTQRGCRLKCSFCVVPRKEGAVSEEATIAGIWRGEPHPRELLLLDNDFFGQPRWSERIEELRAGAFRVSFNQGINARFLTPETAAAIASVDYRDDSMKVKRIYTAWDNRKDEDRLFRGLGYLRDAGVKPDHVMVYMLIGYWPGETEADWLDRWAKLRAFGCRPYPMPFVRNSLTLGFQRWIIGAYDKRIPWDQWKAARCDPRKLERPGRMALNLFGDDPCEST